MVNFINFVKNTETKKATITIDSKTPAYPHHQHNPKD